MCRCVCVGCVWVCVCVFPNWTIVFMCGPLPKYFNRLYYREEEKNFFNYLAKHLQILCKVIIKRKILPKLQL